METTRAKFSADMPWTTADLFFLNDALARGMSGSPVGCNNRSVIATTQE
jgi:hypothetical protein